MKNSFTSIVLLLFTLLLNSQTPQLKWAKQFNCSGASTDISKKIKVDANGNSWTIGQVDNPGKGIDWQTVKRNKNGDTLWTRTFNGPSNGTDIPVDFVMDASGYLFVVGTVSTNSNGLDIEVVRYSPTGNEDWAFRFDYNGSSATPRNLYDDIPVGIDIDDQLKLIVAGTGYQPGGGGDQDILMFSLTTAGNFRRYDIEHCYNCPFYTEDIAKGMKVYGNKLWIIAEVKSPSSTSVSYWDIFRFRTDNTIYDFVNDLSGKNYIGYPSSAQSYQNTPTSLEIDGGGNLFVTGKLSTTSNFSYDQISTIFIPVSQSTYSWHTEYSNSNANTKAPTAIKVDGSNNSYVTGWETNSNGNKDYVTIKYDNSGVEKWTKNKNGSGNGDDIAYALALDASFNPIVTGKTYNSSGNNDITTIKYDKVNGNPVWDIPFNAGFDEEGYSIAVNSYNDIFITGYTSTSSQAENFLTLNYCGYIPIADAGNDTSICQGGSIQLNASGGTYFSWSPTTGLSNPNISNPIATPSGTTKYYVAVSESYGCSALDSIIITVLPKPSDPVLTSNSPICEGQIITLSASSTTTGVSYSWTGPNSFTSPVQNPTINISTPAYAGTYTCIVTKNGCTSSPVTINIVINLKPVATVNGNTSLCQGDSVMISVTQGTSYDWTASIPSIGATSQNIYVKTSGTYTCKVTNTNGSNCIASTLPINITVNTVNTTTTKSGINLSANAIGALYQWVKCPAYSFISGATNQNYTPTSNGDYAVIVTQNGCKDTSNCTTVSGVGINDYFLSNIINVIPNPNNGEFNIIISTPINKVGIEIYNNLGALVFKQTIISQINTIDLKNQAIGLYFIKVIDNKNQIVTGRIVKSN